MSRQHASGSGARIRIDDNDLPFSAWVRDNPKFPPTILGVTDIDSIAYRDEMLVFHRHHQGQSKRVQHIMLIEVKQHGMDLTASQRDTLLLLSHALTEVRVDGVRGPRHSVEKNVMAQCREVHLYTWGVHVLCFSGTTPDDSDTIVWDRSEINAAQLEKLLLFELDPFTLEESP